MERLAFYINRKIHYVDVIRKNNKHLYLKIINQKIIATSPKKTPISVIKSFVNLHIEKFVRHLEKSKTQQLYDLNHKYLYLFNQKYSLKILTGFEKSHIKVYKQIIYLKLNNDNHQNLSIILQKFINSQLLNYLKIKVRYYEKLIKTQKHQIKVVNKFSNWASNITHQNCLSFSNKLVHFSQETIDYVIVHELIHDFEPNHSLKFWKKVREFYPDYKLQIEHLKNF